MYRRATAVKLQPDSGGGFRPTTAPSDQRKVVLVLTCGAAFVVSAPSGGTRGVVVPRARRARVVGRSTGRF